MKRENRFNGFKTHYEIFYDKEKLFQKCFNKVFQNISKMFQTHLGRKMVLLDRVEISAKFIMKPHVWFLSDMRKWKQNFLVYL